MEESENHLRSVFVEAKESLAESIIADLADYRHKRVMGLAGMFGDHMLTSEMPACLSVSVCLSVCLSGCLSVCLSVRPKFAVHFFLSSFLPSLSNVFYYNLILKPICYEYVNLPSFHLSLSLSLSLMPPADNMAIGRQVEVVSALLIPDVKERK